MSWWLWLIIVPVGLYFIAGVAYTIHTIKEVRRGSIRMTRWYSWVMNFVAWPVALIAEAAINGMLM